MEILTNILLFLGSLILLVDIAPKDLLRSHRAKVSALSKLRKEGNILNNFKNGFIKKPETSDFHIIIDSETFNVLKGIIIDYCNKNTSIKPNWERTIGIGYKTLFLPGDVNKLPAFKTVYLAEIPEDNNNDRLTFSDICQLNDLDNWLFKQHKTSLTYTAMIFLVIGFLLQLLTILCNS